MNVMQKLATQREAHNKFSASWRKHLEDSGSVVVFENVCLVYYNVNMFQILLLIYSYLSISL